jgi:hypothetical protein
MFQNLDPQHGPSGQPLVIFFSTVLLFNDITALLSLKGVYECVCVCVCLFSIIYFQECAITYAILHALFYLSRCLNSCEFNRLVLYISYCLCFVCLLVSWGLG